MKVKTEPILGAAALGVVVTILYTLIDTIAGYTRPVPSYTAFGTTGSCLVVLANGLAIGLLYAWLHQKSEPLTTGTAAKGGALSGLLAYTIGGVFTVVVALILLPDIMAQEMAAFGLSSDLIYEAQGLTLAGIAVGVGGSACALAFGAALLSSVGSMVGAAVGNR